MILNDEEVLAIAKDVHLPFQFKLRRISIVDDHMDVSLITPLVYAKALYGSFTNFGFTMSFSLPKDASDVYMALTAAVVWFTTHEMIEMCSQNGERWVHPHGEFGQDREIRDACESATVDYVKDFVRVLPPPRDNARGNWSDSKPFNEPLAVKAGT